MKMKAKIGRLEAVRSVLIECMNASTKDENEWRIYAGMLGDIMNLITEERRKLGHMAVYPIGSGCSQQSLFEGSIEQCSLYIDILLRAHPEMKDKIIINPL